MAHADSCHRRLAQIQQALLCTQPPSCSATTTQATTAGSSGGGGFELIECTIADIQDALRAGSLTCVELVNMYLKRIKAYNGQSCHYPNGLLGDEVELVPSSGQLNALATLNLRPTTREAMGFEDLKARSLTDDMVCSTHIFPAPLNFRRVTQFNVALRRTMTHRCPTRSR
jgi:hypothetical protein